MSKSHGAPRGPNTTITTSNKKKKRKSPSSSSSSPSFSSSPYAPAARILNELWNPQHHRRGLKAIVYDKTTGQLTCSKATYAQVCEVLKHQSLLNQVLQDDNHQHRTSNKDDDDDDDDDDDGDDDDDDDTDKPTTTRTRIQAKNKGLLYVLLYELLFGPHQSIQGGGALKRQLMQHETALRTIAANARKHAPAAAPVEFPRYVRINPLWPGTTLSKIWTEIQQCVRTGNDDDSNSNDRNDTGTSANKKKKKKKRQSSTATADDAATAIYRDRHVPDLLVLPKNASSPFLNRLLQQNSYLSPHRIVLQDKSSCFSALCLVKGFSESFQEDGSGNVKTNRRVYLDACAAPGNKTSHLAALLMQQNQSHFICQQQEQEQETSSNKNPEKTKKKKTESTSIRVYALDRSKERCDTLKRRMEQMVSASSSSVEVIVQCQDFLQTPNAKTTNDLSAVTDILLDPSCSGSGIFNSLDRSHDTLAEEEEGDDNDDVDDDDAIIANNDKSKTASDGQKNSKSNQQSKRLQSLSNFQQMALRHAMTAFPAVERIVYSTCSIHEQENENVVAQALARDRSSSSSPGQWELVAPACLQSWPCRGKSVSGLTADESSCLIRVDGPEYETNGFFVACLQKRRNKAKNQTTKEQSSVAMEDSASVLTRPTKKERKNAGSKKDSNESLIWSEIPLYPGKAVLAEGSSRDDKLPEPTSQLDKTDKTRKGRMISKTTTSPKSDHNDDKPAGLSKKAAKKLEWKRRQRIAKEERLQKKSRTE
ncbi:hypothetical protein ACA910_015127 [Epithemia clementina (nom. ined.)]